MALSNPSQLLLRNEQYLIAKNPLVIGCPDQQFFAEMININPSSTISSWQVNYAEFEQTENKYKQQLHCQFSHQYQNLSDDKHDLVIIYFPKSKQEYQFVLAMIAEHLSSDAVIVVVGENKGGVKSCAKLSTTLCSSANKVDSARHCAMFYLPFNGQAQPFNIDDWFSYFDINVADTELTIASLPGVFSNGELDNGTRLLLEHLPKSLSGKVLDFGCGAGIIGAFVKKKFAKTDIDLIDVNAFALASAKKTLEKNQLIGKVFASNGLSKVTGKYQSVISNPPFHQGIKTNYQVTELFLTEIKQNLSKNANLTIVANNFLRYAPIIKQHLAQPELLANSKGFAIHFCKI